MRRLGPIGLILILLLAGCATLRGPREPIAGSPALQAALEKAGSNRGEIQGVLDYYEASGDTLKLQAARTLIENMQGKCFVGYTLRDSAGAEVAFNALDHPDYESMVAALDSIEAERGELDFERNERAEDLEVIKASYLIENIDLAFQAWRSNPWSRHLTFQDFCAYVLPYRGSNEPLESWRRRLFRPTAVLAARMEDPEDPVEAARLINEDLKRWFTFDPRYYCHPTDQGLSEMLESGMGRCEDMTNLAIYAMRANGLAVTSDYTPYWADAGNNHAWNAILDRNARAIPFMGCEAHPGEYRLANRVAKVYRKMFAEQKGNLAFQKPEDEEVPRWLAGTSYRDVTSDYVDVSDVTVSLIRPRPDDVHFAYLCVFNDGEWRAIAWGRLDGEQVTFTDMGRNIAYLPAYYAGGELLPAAPAFILEPDGTVRILSVNEAERQTLRLVSTTRRKVVASTDGTARAFLEPGRSYELSYWDDRWVAVSNEVAGSEPLVFEGVPSGGLYWLTAESSRREERIFTYEQDAQLWW